MSENAVLHLRRPVSALDPVLARMQDAANHLGISTEELEAEISEGRIQDVRAGDRELEIRLHLLLLPHRLRGEWYRPGPAVMEEVYRA